MILPRPLQLASFTILVLSFLLISACKKKDPPPVRYTISCSGKMLVGETLQFQSNVPTDKKIVWIFPDGEFSTEATPKHIFKKTGTYNVMLVIDNDTSNSKGLNPYRTIEVRLPFDPAAIQRMAGTRYWDVYKDSLVWAGASNYRRPDTFAHYSDTFAIQVINSTTIVVKGDTLTNSYDQNYGVLDHYTFNVPETEYSWKTLCYYFNNDSIVYFHHPYQGGVTFAGKPPLVYPQGVTTTYRTK